MKNYMARLSDIMLINRLESKGAVLIEGPKWCGKTTTAKHIAKSYISMDEPSMSKQYKKMSELNPQELLKGRVPRLIDEWQLTPNLWNAVRYEVDQRDEFGQFILTGSAVPARFDDSMHTGTGRIVRMLMRPMSLYESGDSSGSVSLKELFEDKKLGGIDNHTIDDIAYLICRGGWPRAICKEKHIALQQAIDYYDAIVSNDVSRASGSAKNKERTKKLLKSYARHIATQASFATILKDIKANDIESFSEATLYSYVEALKNIFVIEDMPAWNPNLRSKTAIRTADTRYFIDPSIAAAALGVGPWDLISDINTMGLMFENLCVRDLRIYAESLDGSVYHYRDKSDLECDAIIHLRDGSYGMIEIKLGGDSSIDEGAKTLKKLEERIDTERMKKPSFMMVLCGIAPYAYTREDGVMVVPIGLLKN